MNLAQFKDPVSNMCLAGAVVASWSLTRGDGWVAGLSPFTVMTNILGKHLGKTQICEIGIPTCNATKTFCAMLSIMLNSLIF